MQKFRKFRGHHQNAAPTDRMISALANVIGIFVNQWLVRNRLDIMSNAVIPAKAGIQCMLVYQGTKAVWIPAFAGMTMVGSKRLRLCNVWESKW
jgi:hypothetical protein